MSTTFAASNEKLTQYNGSLTVNMDKKVSAITFNSKFYNADSDIAKGQYKINIKKPYQKNYKIKSVDIMYFVTDNKTGKPKNYAYRSYTTNTKNTKSNKNSFIINTEITRDMNIDKLTVNYQTNGKIKKESISSTYSKANLKFNIHLIGKKSSANVVQKFHMNNNRANPILMKYQKIKVLTNSKEYKIKAVKLSLANFKNSKISYKLFKGYGKNSLDIQITDNVAVQGIKVYYF
jgi:hypothetical protein